MSDVIREQPARPLKSAPNINVAPPAVPQSSPAPVFKLKVTSFQISGNRAFSEARLQAIVSPYAGKRLSLAELEMVAAEISNFYRSNGYFVAKAYLPAQEISRGIIQIEVMEGEVGSVSINLKGSGRLTEASVQKFVNAAAHRGDVINSNKIERGILLLNDLPGITVSSTMVPGAALGTADLQIDVEQTGSFNGGINYDNFGNKYTGQNRIGATFNFNNPSGTGDQIGFQAMTSGSGLRYLRGGYQMPLAATGAKVGASYSSMYYLLGSDFSALDAQGSASEASLYTSYPVTRSRTFNLNAQLTYDAKKMLDQAGGLVSSDKRDSSWMAAFSGDFRDELGVNSYSSTFTSGLLDLSRNLPSQLIDSASAKTEGGYYKINYSLARIQPLSDVYSLYASFSGQTASGNLDSSDKLVLGGASGIRAYPQGEASGDEGKILNLELRRDLGTNAFGNLQLAGFLDVGNIVLHKNIWTGWQGGNPNLPNSYNLYGAGLGLNLSAPGKSEKLGSYSVKVFFAAKLGSNPGSDINNNDSDNANNKFRIWLQAIEAF